MSDGLLLDTCAAIWLMEGEPMAEPSRAAIRKAAQSSLLFVSPFVGWEVAMLFARKRRLFSAEPHSWFALLAQVPGMSVAPVTAAILISSQDLPGAFHNDPIDRIMISTAHELNLALVTRDRAILDYGAKGQARTLAC